MLRPDIGSYFKQLRKEAGLYQQHLAEESGVDISFISQIETGKRNPSEKIIKFYSEKFNLSTSDIYIIEKNNNFIGIEIKHKRESAGLDIGQMEDRTGIPFFRIAEIEEGIEKPTPEETVKICEALNLSPEHFDNQGELLNVQLTNILKKFGLSKPQIENIKGYINKSINKQK